MYTRNIYKQRVSLFLSSSRYVWGVQSYHSTIRPTMFNFYAVYTYTYRYIEHGAINHAVYVMRILQLAITIL